MDVGCMTLLKGKPLQVINIDLVDGEPLKLGKFNV